MAKTQKKQPTFEEQVERLEYIVDLLDRGETPIDDMMKLYEEGMQLLQSARGYLQGAEQKIAVLQQSYESQSQRTAGDADTTANDNQFLF